MVDTTEIVWFVVMLKLIEMSTEIATFMQTKQQQNNDNRKRCFQTPERFIIARVPNNRKSAHEFGECKKNQMINAEHEKVHE